MLKYFKYSYKLVFIILGAQEKHATVEWFSRIADIPLSQRPSLRQEASDEIFLNENVERDTNILVTSIINSIMVCILTICQLEKREKLLLKCINSAQCIYVLIDI